MKNNYKTKTQQLVVNVGKLIAQLTTSKEVGNCAIKAMCCMSGNVTNVTIFILEKQVGIAIQEQKNTLARLLSNQVILSSKTTKVRNTMTILLILK